MLKIFIICLAQDSIAKGRLFLTYTSRFLEEAKKCNFLEVVLLLRAGFPC